MEEIRDETKKLFKADRHVLMGTAIVQCQSKCLNFQANKLTQQEKTCLKECADKYVFFDSATYEIDSAMTVAHQTAKPKKAYMFY